MGRVVYNSDQGRLCPDCGHPARWCRCASKDQTSRGDGIVRIRREIKGRKGKTVTTITGLPLTAGELKELAGKLKRKCGSGGTIRDGVVEVQGDHVELLLKELAGLGYSVKRSGG